MGQIVELHEIPSNIELWRREGDNIIHCHGCFDLLHIGHLNYFKEAKEKGESEFGRNGSILVVTITPDQFVNKGPNRPIFTAQQRAEMVAELDCVDYVAINNSPSAVESIKIIKPDYYVKGADYKNSADAVLQLEKEAVESVGGKLIFTESELFSSTKLINQHITKKTSDEVVKFLDDFKTRFSISDLFEYLEKVKDLKVVIVGEYIKDRYHYCKTLGKSNKEPILTLQYEKSEEFDGGASATKRHVKSFLSFVELYSNFSICKERYVESYPFQKMFEVYQPIKKFDIDIKRQMKEVLDKFDLVIVNDYGHGMIDQEMVDIICSKAKFLAVNTQTNAGNHGFNTISKYSKADYICLSEEELRLETRNKAQNVKSLMDLVCNDLSCRRMIVTQGNKGLISFDNKALEYNKIPAFTNRFVDRVGAGDAVFGITSLLVAIGIPMEAVGVIGNAVGALAVDIVGNKEPVKKDKLKDFLTQLIK